MHNEQDVKHLLLIPSFYGAALWVPWLLLYWLRLISWDDTTWSANALFILMAGAYTTSAHLLAPRFRALAARPVEDASREWPRTRLILSALHAVGFAGLVKYVIDVAAALGGPAAFLLLLGAGRQAIRGASGLTTTIGTQLSYAGWIAITATIVLVHGRRLSRRWLAPAALQFVGNLLYIDRTRPTSILFASVCVLIPSIRKVSLRLLGVALGGTMAAGIALFLALGLWGGKISSEEGFDSTSPLPPALQNLYLYGTSGFAYFNRMVKTEKDFEYSPVRLGYPLLKALSSLGLAHEPPNQILEFYAMPFETNVGTALVPFYRDGGLLFVLAGVLLLSFGVDLLALHLWRAGGLFPAIAAANLCFASFIAFFVPKLDTFPLWLFCGLGIAAAHRRRVPSLNRSPERR